MALTSYSAHGSNGLCFLHISGLPKKYTWQDLKDLIREHTTHQVWAEMHVHGGHNAGVGSVRVQKADEAWLYTYLTNLTLRKKTLRVHSWDISQATPRFERCNCGNVPSPDHPTSLTPDQISRTARSPYWHTFRPISPPTSNWIVPARPTTLLAQPASQLNEQQMITAMTNMGLNPQVRSNVARLIQSQQTPPSTHEGARAVPPIPTYTSNAAGMPVNIRQGVVATEARAIFVSQLSLKAKKSAIQEFFKGAGSIVGIDLKEDHRTGKSAGCATIQYALASSAQKACEVFDRARFLDMIISVRLAREHTAIGMPPAGVTSHTPRIGATPTIVNGSQSRKHSVASRV